MRGFRGDTGGTEPLPLEIFRDGVLCGYLMGMRGGPKVVLSYYYHIFWLVFTRQYYSLTRIVLKFRGPNLLFHIMRVSYYLGSTVNAQF